MLGNLLNAAFSVALSVVIARFCIARLSDDYTIAFALGVQVYSIANFEIGTLLVTDARDRYSLGHYLTAKLVIMIAAVLFTVGVVGVNYVSGAYDIEKCAVVLLFCGYKLADGMSIYYFSYFQKFGRLDISGYSMAMRVVIALIVFLATLFTTGSLVLALAVMFVSALLWVVLYESTGARRFAKVRLSFDWKTVFTVIAACFPLFVSQFLQVYIINVPKYTLDTLHAAEGLQTAYSAIFQPAAVINLLCIFIFRPFMTRLAEDFQSRRFGNFMKLVLRIAGLLLIASALMMVAGRLAGIPALRTIYGNIILDSYLPAWMMVLTGGVLYAFTCLLYNLIVIIRSQAWLIVGYLIPAVVGWLIAPGFIEKWSLTGAAATFTVSNGVLFIIFVAVFAVSCLHKMRSEEI